MKVFIVFSLPNQEDWVEQKVGEAAGLLAADGATSFVVIDNDSCPELEPLIASVAGRLGAKVHRVSRAPRWKIASDVLYGQAAAGVSTPTLIASAADPRLAQPIEITGVLGPRGDVSQNFVFTENPVEFIATLEAKMRGWPHGDPFAPAVYVDRQGPRHAAPMENLATMFGVDAAGIPTPAANDRAPQGVHPSIAAFYGVHLPDEAAHFLVRLQTASQIADDFVDDAIPASWKSDSMRELLEILLLEIPHDPFYSAHRAELEEAVAQCISVWSLSNTLSGDITPESRMWCYINREIFQMVVWRVAVIVGGLAHGRLVLSGFQQLLHGPVGGAKRFNAWLDEVRAASGRG